MDITDLSLHQELQSNLDCWMETFWLAGTKIDWRWHTGRSLDSIYSILNKYS